MQAYDRVSIARAKGRPTALKFIGAIFEDFFELHGDRLFGDDGAIVGGVALLGRQARNRHWHRKGRRHAR